MTFRDFVIGLLDTYFPVTPAPAVPQTIETGRPLSAAECKARIRNLLSDTRFAFRTLGALAKGTGWSSLDLAGILPTMPDVRPSRNNHRKMADEQLFTFAEVGSQPGADPYDDSADDDE